VTSSVLAAAFLFNLGQGVLRPAMPLYLQQAFGASYRMVTLIPMVFGAGRWGASLPTGHWLDRLGRRRMMVTGLTLIACCDVGSALASRYGSFLGWRALAGAGWAMFATVATTTMVDTSAARRARRVSALLMSESLGLLVGSAASGWTYQGLGPRTPFGVEATCMLAAALVVWRTAPPSLGQPVPAAAPRWRDLLAVLRTPGVVRMGLANAGLVAVQTGVVVFLLPLYWLNRVGLDPGAVGLLVSVSIFGRLLALALAGGIVDPGQRRRALSIGLVAHAVLLGAVTVVAGAFALGVWSLALGAAAGLVAPLPAAIVGDLVTPAERARAIAWFRTMTDAGQILGPLVLGAMADAADIATPFGAAAALLMAAAWIARRPRRTSSRRSTTRR